MEFLQLTCVQHTHDSDCETSKKPIPRQSPAVHRCTACERKQVGDRPDPPRRAQSVLSDLPVLAARGESHAEVRTALPSGHSGGGGAADEIVCEQKISPERENGANPHCTLSCSSCTLKTLGSQGSTLIHAAVWKEGSLWNERGRNPLEPWRGRGSRLSSSCCVRWEAVSLNSSCGCGEKRE